VTRGVHHLDLVVSSIERSLPFYRELLDPLGYTRMGEVQGERGETIWYIAGAGTVVGVREARRPAATTATAWASTTSRAGNSIGAGPYLGTSSRF